MLTLPNEESRHPAWKYTPAPRQLQRNINVAGVVGRTSSKLLKIIAKLAGVQSTNPTIFIRRRSPLAGLSPA
jgi:hypothetical protein